MTLLYDAENRQKIAYQTIYGEMDYLYDGNGQRVEKKYPDTSFGIYVYDVQGQLAAEYYSDSGTASPCTTCYFSWDHLGSTRLITDQSGNLVTRHDFLPFGEEIASGSAGRNSEFGQSDIVNQKFTGQEHDSESGLDFFNARYLSAGLGRFTSPDPHTGTALHLINPQRWNMYAYGLNNPLFYTDSTGKDAIAVGLTSEVPVVGHVGIISLHQDGTAIYSRYGPVTPGVPFGTGQTSSFILPKVTFDQFGNPTQDSFRALTKAVAGYEQQAPNTVNMAFFKTSEADTIALDNWIREQSKRNSVLSKYYSFLGNSCVDFCERGLMVARAPVDLTSMSSIPNLLMLDLQVFSDSFYSGDQQPQQQQQKEPPTSVTSEFCYTDDNGKQVCQ